MIPHSWLQQDALHRCGKRDQQHQNPRRKMDTNTLLSNPLVFQSHYTDLAPQTNQKKKRKKKAAFRHHLSISY